VKLRGGLPQVFEHILQYDRDPWASIADLDGNAKPQRHSAIFMRPRASFDLEITP
jgi:hypothetical protein